MKLKKFKYLLSIGASALAIAPIASLAINANNNAIVKTNVVNNADDAQQGTTDSSSTLITPVQPQDGSVDVSTLSPVPNDLYNDYNFASGYVIKDVANNKISFYNWFKQEVWSLDVSTVITSLAGENHTNSLETMNVRGALNADGTYDNKKLFVYGNLKGTGDDTTTTTTGSYVFEVDMTTGALVENSLVENSTVGTDENNSATLIGDVQQLTVIDNTTVVVSSDISNNTDNNTHSFSISVLTLSENNAPAIKTYTSDFKQTADAAAAAVYSQTFGEVLGVIKKENQFVFAMTASDINKSSTTATYDLKINYFYFKLSGVNLLATKFTESGALTGDQNASDNGTPVDTQTVLNSVPRSEITSETNSSGQTNTQQVTDAQNWLETKCTNFSVVYPGTAADPKMMISYNWDTTDITPDVGTNDTGKNMVTMVSFNKTTPTNTKDNPNAVIFSLYKMPNNVTTVSGSGSGSSTPLLGISNLVYTRTMGSDKQLIQPYAVIVGQNTFGGKVRVSFNFVKLDSNAELSNTSATANSGGSATPTINGNQQTAVLNSNATMFYTDDYYTVDGAALIGTSNINKMDWNLQFIPNNGTATSGTTIDNYYGYISTGIENDGKVNYQENFFKLPATISAYTEVPNLNLNDWQFGITQAQLEEKYKAITASDTLNSLDPNAFATNATAQSVIDNLYQM
ncbi:MAG: hypothetical protein HUJ42_03820, partial [Malacoplasma sp.]|nr:hypothetical protein [Malacoplasma sp.]